MSDFKKSYKSEMDKIEPSARLLDKISVDMQTEISNPTPKIRFITVRNIASAAAAVAIIVAAGVMLPSILGGNELSDGEIEVTAENTDISEIVTAEAETEKTSGEKGDSPKLYEADGFLFSEEAVTSADESANDEKSSENSESDKIDESLNDSLIEAKITSRDEASDDADAGTAEEPQRFGIMPTLGAEEPAAEEPAESASGGAASAASENTQSNQEIISPNTENETTSFVTESVSPEYANEEELTVSEEAAPIEAETTAAVTTAPVVITTPITTTQPTVEIPITGGAVNDIITDSSNEIAEDEAFDDDCDADCDESIGGAAMELPAASKLSELIYSVGGSVPSLTFNGGYYSGTDGNGAYEEYSVTSAQCDSAAILSLVSENLAAKKTDLPTTGNMVSVQFANADNPEYTFIYMYVYDNDVAEINCADYSGSAYFKLAGGAYGKLSELYKAGIEAAYGKAKATDFPTLGTALKGLGLTAAEKMTDLTLSFVVSDVSGVWGIVSSDTARIYSELTSSSAFGGAKSAVSENYSDKTVSASFTAGGRGFYVEISGNGGIMLNADYAGTAYYQASGGDFGALLNYVRSVVGLKPWLDFAALSDIMNAVGLTSSSPMSEVRLNEYNSIRNVYSCYSLRDTDKISEMLGTVLFDKTLPALDNDMGSGCFIFLRSLGDTLIYVYENDILRLVGTNTCFCESFSLPSGTYNTLRRTIQTYGFYSEEAGDEDVSEDAT